MKFRFTGQEPSDFMGFQWFPGTEHDVTDEHAIKKLSGSVLFEKSEGKSAPEGKKNGKKQQPVTDNGDDPNAA